MTKPQVLLAYLGAGLVMWEPTSHVHARAICPVNNGQEVPVFFLSILPCSTSTRLYLFVFIPIQSLAHSKAPILSPSGERQPCKQVPFAVWPAGHELTGNMSRPEPSC